jgi:hypothetical protein
MAVQAREAARPGGPPWSARVDWATAGVAALLVVGCAGAAVGDMPRKLGILGVCGTLILFVPRRMVQLGLLGLCLLDGVVTSPHVLLPASRLPPDSRLDAFHIAAVIGFPLLVAYGWAVVRRQESGWVGGAAAPPLLALLGLYLINLIVNFDILQFTRWAHSFLMIVLVLGFYTVGAAEGHLAVKRSPRMLVGMLVAAGLSLTAVAALNVGAFLSAGHALSKHNAVNLLFVHGTAAFAAVHLAVFLGLLLEGRSATVRAVGLAVRLELPVVKGVGEHLTLTQLAGQV